MITYEIFVKLVSNFSKNSEKKKDFQSFSVFMELQFLHLFIWFSWCRHILYHIKVTCAGTKSNCHTIPKFFIINHNEEYQSIIKNWVFSVSFTNESNYNFCLRKFFLYGSPDFWKTFFFFFQGCALRILFQSNGHLKEILWVVIFNFEVGTEKLWAKKFV